MLCRRAHFLSQGVGLRVSHLLDGWCLMSAVLSSTLTCLLIVTLHNRFYVAIASDMDTLRQECLLRVLFLDFNCPETAGS